MTETEDRFKAFEERMAERKPQNDEKEAQRQEQLRQDYLKRTGRTELKP